MTGSSSMSPLNHLRIKYTTVCIALGRHVCLRQIASWHRMLKVATRTSKPDGVDGSRPRHLSAKVGCCQANPSDGATHYPVSQHDARAAGRVRHQHPRRPRTCVDDGARGTRGAGARCAGGGGQDHLRALAEALDTHSHVREIDRALAALQRSDDMARRLATIPGIGPIGATALAASVTDPGQFRSGRQFAAWLGLTPLQNSSGGKERLGRISKMGDKYLRKLLVIGATALVRYAKSKPETAHPHLVNLLARKPVRVATVAMANKMARIVWGGPDARRSLPARPRAGTVGIAGRTKFSGEISFRRLRARRAVMAKPVRPGTGTPHGMSKASLPEKQNGTRLAEPVRASSPKSTASTGRTEDCTRPTRQISKLRLHQGSHPQRTSRNAATPNSSVPGSSAIPRESRCGTGMTSNMCFPHTLDRLRTDLRNPAVSSLVGSVAPMRACPDSQLNCHGERHCKHLRCSDVIRSKQPRLGQVRSRSVNSKHQTEHKMVLKCNLNSYGCSSKCEWHARYGKYNA